MPQKHKNNKIRIKINDKKITNYMFDFTRTIIFVFAIISVAFTFIIRDANVVGNSILTRSTAMIKFSLQILCMSQNAAIL